MHLGSKKKCTSWSPDTFTTNSNNFGLCHDVSLAAVVIWCLVYWLPKSLFSIKGVFIYFLYPSSILHLPLHLMALTLHYKISTLNSFEILSCSVARFISLCSMWILYLCICSRNVSYCYTHAIYYMSFITMTCITKPEHLLWSDIDLAGTECSWNPHIQTVNLQLLSFTPTHLTSNHDLTDYHRFDMT